MAAEAVRDLLAAYRPVGWPLVFAVDRRPGRAVTPSAAPLGACTTTLAALGGPADRGGLGLPVGLPAGLGAPLVDSAGRRPSDPADGRSGAGDRRAGSCAGPAARGDAAPTAVTAIPLLVFDAGYDPIALTCGLAEAGVRVAVLVRIRSDRVFYTDPPRRAPGATGRPRKHGRRVALQEPASWPAPDDQLTVCDARYGQVTVAAWAGLHPKLWTRGRFAEATVPRSCAAPSSGSRSADCPSPPAGSRSCGCGGQARERRIWTWSGGRTCAASTWK